LLCKSSNYIGPKPVEATPTVYHISLSPAALVVERLAGPESVAGDVALAVAPNFGDPVADEDELAVIMTPSNPTG
jgi:hypothetical protein